MALERSQQQSLRSPQAKEDQSGMQTERMSQPKIHALVRDISQENTPTDPVVVQLQRQLANAYILYTNYKYYHWNVYGPLFRDLHLLFDEFAHAVLATIDKFAERIRMIGQDPIFSPLEMTETASVKIAERGKTLRDMIAEADVNLLGVIKEMRAGVRAADKEGDPGTAALFSEVIQMHEKHEWWLRDMLEKRDGLTD